MTLCRHLASNKTKSFSPLQLTLFSFSFHFRFLFTRHFLWLHSSFIHDINYFFLTVPLFLLLPQNLSLFLSNFPCAFVLILLSFIFLFATVSIINSPWLPFMLAYFLPLNISFAVINVYPKCWLYLKTAIVGYGIQNDFYLSDTDFLPLHPT